MTENATPPQRILVVEDDSGMRALLLRVLKENGYHAIGLADGRAMWEALKDAPADAILLDVGLPGVSGLDLCRELRRTSGTPIIMVSARGEELDRVLGLELGADDYVTKPYSSRELLARIRAVLRRGGEVDEGEDPATLAAGPVRMDVERHVVTLGGEPLSLPLKEFELLEVLLRNAGRVLTRGQLIDRVWGSDYVGDTKTLDVHVKRLRAKIEADPASPTLLLTVRGLGYKLTDDGA